MICYDKISYVCHDNDHSDDSQSSGSEYNGDLDDGEIKPVDHSSMQDELHEGVE